MQKAPLGTEASSACKGAQVSAQARAGASKWLLCVLPCDQPWHSYGIISSRFREFDATRPMKAPQLHNRYTCIKKGRTRQMRTRSILKNNTWNTEASENKQ